MNARTDAYRNLHFVTAQEPRPSGFAWAGRLATRMRDLIGRWLWRKHYREELEHLSEHQLRDVGLDREAVRLEADKPFWRA